MRERKDIGMLGKNGMIGFVRFCMVVFFGFEFFLIEEVECRLIVYFFILIMFCD